MTLTSEATSRSTFGVPLLTPWPEEDEKRFNEGELLTDKDELMVMAQKKEDFLLEFEAEMRAAGLTPDPRATESSFHAPPPSPRPHRVGIR